MSTVIFTWVHRTAERLLASEVGLAPVCRKCKKQRTELAEDIQLADYI